MAEEFLLEALTAGHSVSEIEQSVRLALDHWRALSQTQEPAPDNTLRFFGSHDPAIALIAARFPDITGSHTLSLSFAGSLGGLMALVQGKADLAGSHLWDEEHDTYNEALVTRLFSGARVALLTLAHRRLGLITKPGTPLDIYNLDHLTKPGVRFVNRQPGAGTRVWLDAHLRSKGISSDQIVGYEDETPTHSEVVQRIAESEADVGLGVEAAALAYGLNFTTLTTERYDLVLREATCTSPPIQALVAWMSSSEGKGAISRLGGYDTEATGQVTWVG
jgi:putative molybdopterin biosynthesis protein